MLYIFIDVDDAEDQRMHSLHLQIKSTLQSSCEENTKFLRPGRSNALWDESYFSQVIVQMQRSPEVHLQSASHMHQECGLLGWLGLLGLLGLLGF